MKQTASQVTQGISLLITNLTLIDGCVGWKTWEENFDSGSELCIHDKAIGTGQNGACDSSYSPNRKPFQLASWEEGES